MKKFLIIQIRQLGDVLLSTPLAECLKKHFPDAEVHFLTAENAQEILELNPYIDCIHLLKDGIINEFKMSRRIYNLKFDGVIDIQRTGRSKRITLFSSAKKRVGFKRKKDNFYYNQFINYQDTGYTVVDRLLMLEGINIKDDWNKYHPKIIFNTEHLEAAKQLKQKLNLTQYCIIVPTARRIRKMWPPAQMGNLMDRIYNELNITPIIAYGPGEQKLAKTYSDACKSYHILLESPLPIKIFAAFVSLSNFFIGNNSFASHVALTQKIKSAIFTGTDLEWFPKISDHFLPLVSQTDCQQCKYLNTCKQDKEMDTYLKCFESLTSETVFKQLIKFLGEK